MLSGKPVRGETYFLIQRLLETELPSGAIRGSYNIASEIAASGCNARSLFECLADFGVGIIACVISTIANWNEDVVAYNNCDAVVLALVSLPLQRGR